jgi:hypothetical protein
MKNLRPIAFIAATAALAGLFSGCASAPATFSYNGEQVPAMNLTAITCSNPYELSQDCSSFSGAKRKVQIGGLEVKVAGSAAGDVVLLMASGLTFKPEELRAAGVALEKMAADRGIQVLERKAGGNGSALAALMIVFDGDVYSLLQ